jgi:hypothetical protein
MKRILLSLGLFSCLSTAALADTSSGPNPDRLTVHEWGTFTALQDENGNELVGINIDDEPVPEFVHDLAPYLHNSPVLTNEHWRYRFKGAPRRHPHVTMRLETPVLYFYPPKSQTTPLNVNVNVSFRGGWLTEFYPYADATAPKLESGRFAFEELTRDTVGGLSWRNVQVGTKASGPQTEEHVWTAPRKVASASVTAESGESERYLFYRGVGHIRAPLSITTGSNQQELSLYANFDEVMTPDESLTIRHAWLADIRQEGTRFKTLEPMEITGNAKQRVSSVNADPASLTGSLEELQQAMHQALVEEGLFADEATAMLATWERAYFQSPGLRVFFVVPRNWVDHYLPLTISSQADVTRVMMARIELITPEQRALLARLADTTPSDGSWLTNIPESEARDRFMAGRSEFGDLGITIPADYQMYLALGRFRNALVVHEERLRPTKSLTQFIDTYGLHPFRTPTEKSVASREASP